MTLRDFSFVWGEGTRRKPMPVLEPTRQDSWALAAPLPHPGELDALALTHLRDGGSVRLPHGAAGGRGPSFRAEERPTNPGASMDAMSHGSPPMAEG